MTHAAAPRPLSHLEASPPDAALATFPALTLDSARRTPRRAAIREEDHGIWQAHRWRDCAERSRLIGDTIRENSENEDVKESYLGLSRAGQRKSDRGVEHAERRERWRS